MESSTPPRDTAWTMSEENVEIARRIYEVFEEQGVNEESVFG